MELKLVRTKLGKNYEKKEGHEKRIIELRGRRKK
jgi:hypothetical protein